MADRTRSGHFIGNESSRRGRIAATRRNVCESRTGNTVATDSIPDCNTAMDNGVTTATLQLSAPMPNGAFVETTLNASSGTIQAEIVDAAANAASAPQSRQATATAPETTAPTLVSASGAVGSSVLTLVFSEPVYPLTNG